MNDTPNDTPNIEAVEADTSDEGRRGFLARVLAVVTGGVATVVPAAVALVAALDPVLRHKKKSGANWIRVTSLETVPADGQPMRFPVEDRQRDAWTVYPSQPVGAVYLRRTGAEAPVQAFTDECPHLGCSVAFKDNLNTFRCPCHNSAWKLDGSRINPETCPSPRDLDELQVEIREGDVYVDFQRFRTGIAEKQPV